MSDPIAERLCVPIERMLSTIPSGRKGLDPTNLVSLLHATFGGIALPSEAKKRFRPGRTQQPDNVDPGLNVRKEKRK